MHAAENQRRSEATVARRRHRERHLENRQRLQTPPEALQLRLFDAGAGAASIDQPSVRIVIGEQQRADPRPRTFGSVQPTTTNSSRCRHLTLTHNPRLPGA